MEITQVRVHLKDSEGSKLKAFVTVTFDDMFVVRDLKVIEGRLGLFVAMPSVKMKEPCPQCHKKIPVRSRFCCECGAKLPEHNPMHSTDEEERDEHKDIAHPVTAQAREYIKKVVLDAYHAETKGYPS